jgi:hypothetical protein
LTSSFKQKKIKCIEREPTTNFGIRNQKSTNREKTKNFLDFSWKNAYFSTKIIKSFGKEWGIKLETTLFLKEQKLGYSPVHLSQFALFWRKLTFFEGGVALINKWQCCSQNTRKIRLPSQPLSSIWRFWVFGPYHYHLLIKLGKYFLSKRSAKWPLQSAITETIFWEYCVFCNWLSMEIIIKKYDLQYFCRPWCCIVLYTSIKTKKWTYELPCRNLSNHTGRINVSISAQRYLSILKTKCNNRLLYFGVLVCSSWMQRFFS